ncbi:hypothetical protein RF11_14778 [Thelohanellus kitauei]|uniref:Integrase catalytic domain-containing protein n=1 Tax=Thelohanellus kitauei TaxID=669202 RepID=A0A0C2JJE8_THEKT|nr:hypothetical protein RF11_14778 [Thelohanellus kitauei]
MSNRDGMRCDLMKIKPIIDYPIHRSFKDVQKFMGLANYCQRFIQGLAEISRPLHSIEIQKECFDFNEECSKAFHKVNNVHKIHQFWLILILLLNLSFTVMQVTKQWVQYWSRNNIKRFPFPSPPYTSSSNGQAERFYPTFKSSINKQMIDGTDLDEAVFEFLLMYRSTQLDGKLTLFE